MTNELVCVGHASVDHHFEIDAFPARPTKTPASSYRMIVGGMAANAAIAGTRLGAAVRLIGRVGDDAAGAFVRGELQALGLARCLLEPVAGASTSVSSVVVDAQGERQIFNHRGSALSRAHALDVSLLDGARALLVDPRWVPGAEAALRWAQTHEVLSVLDADVAPRPDLARLVPLARWAVFSEAGLQVFAPGLPLEAALRAAVRCGARVAMVTLGAHGVAWTRGEGIERLGGFVVQPVDTTGAGDVFHGALTLALGERMPERDAVRFASAAAALKCERRPGVLGTPGRQEVERYLARQVDRAN